MSLKASACQVTLPLPAAGDPPPSRLPLIPAPVDGKVSGKDGRKWDLSDTSKVLDQLNKLGRPLVLDENHSELLKAPKGEPSPAMARLSDFTVEQDGTLWANNVEWTPKGKEQWSGYLGISPTFLYSPKEGSDSLGEIVGLHSVGLTNDPNLQLPAAMNAAEDGTLVVETAGEPTFGKADVEKMIAAAVAGLVTQLGSIEAAVKALTPKGTEAAPNAADNAAKAAERAEKAAKDAEAAASAQLQVAANNAITAAVAEGKVLPSEESRAFWVETYLRSPKETQAQFDRMPKVLPSRVQTGANTQGGKRQLTQEQKDMCRRLGIEEKDFVFSD